MKIAFTSEFSDIPIYAGKCQVIAERGDGTKIFETTYDSPWGAVLHGLDKILENDLLDRDVRSDTYRLYIAMQGDDAPLYGGEAELTVMYCTTPHVKFKDWAGSRFLTSRELIMYPGGWSEDVKVPVYTDPESDLPRSVHIIQNWVENGELKVAEMDYPISEGFDEITIHASNFMYRPLSVYMVSGERILSILFPERSASNNFIYRDCFNQDIYLALDGVTFETPSFDSELVYRNGQLKKVLTEDQTTYTLNCEGLAPVTVRAARALLRSHYVRLNGEEIIVTDISGDIDDDPTKTKTLKITYRKCY